MAAMLNPIPAPGGAGGVTFQKATAEDRYQALALLLTGRWGTQEPVVDHFLTFAGGQDLALDQIWTARQGDRAVAAAMVVPCAGRTGMAFTCPVQDRRHAEVCGQLVDHACAGQDAQRVRLVQALVDPHLTLQAWVFESAGFMPLATLMYMEGRAVPGKGSLDLGPDLQVVAWEDRRREQFAQAILASYEETLDCPKLRGLRHIEDIIDGHMATGRFEAPLWHLVLLEERPAGVMLLNELPQQQALELVYLGLAPACRGRGVGTKLVRHGLTLAARRGCRAVLCAVDAANRPALALYERVGFRTTGRKLALIRCLPPGV